MNHDLWKSSINAMYEADAVTPICFIRSIRAKKGEPELTDHGVIVIHPDDMPDYITYYDGVPVLVFGAKHQQLRLV